MESKEDTSLRGAKAEASGSSSERPLILCLSGGGFRALLFHIGVVRALRDAGILDRVRMVTSVSGGSVLAAHLVANWTAYTGTAREFDAAVKPLLKLCRRDVRGRIARRLPALLLLRLILGGVVRMTKPILPSSVLLFLESWQDRLTTTGRLAREYRRVLGTSLLASLPETITADRSTAIPPLLLITATNLTKADLCAFSRHGFSCPPSLQPEDNYGASYLTSADAVAASSAFPGFFTPLHLCRSVLHWDRAGHFAGDDQFVTDAGVYDNLGLDTAVRFAPLLPGSRIIISDASGGIDWSATTRMRWLLPSVVRTIDIIMARNNSLQLQVADADDDSTSARTPIVMSITSSSQDRSRVADSKGLKNIRTDFDDFDAAVIRTLTQHGYSLARRRLIETGETPSSGQTNDETSPQWPLGLLHLRAPAPRAEARRIGLAATRRILFTGSTLLDAATWMIIGLLAFSGALIAAGLQMRDEQLLREHAARLHAYAVSRPPEHVSSFEYPLPAPQLEPRYGAFEFLRDDRIYDLRPMRQDGTLSPTNEVSLLRTMRVRKLGNEDAIAFQFRTSGRDVYLQCKNRKYTNHALPERDGLKVRQIVVDVADVHEGDEFDVQLAATFLDAFVTPEQQWAGILCLDKVTRSSMLVIFPDDRPVLGTRCMKQLEGKPEASIDSGRVSIFNPDQGYAFLMIENPEPASIYKLKWQWNEG